LPDYIPRRNRNNNYGYDPQEQDHQTYTGMGADINVHDQWACESMGQIADRTQEHLGRSDKAIAAYRRLLRRAIDTVDKGEQPPMIFNSKLAAKITGPAAVDGIGPTDDWQGYWQKTDAGKRSAATWAPTR
jgi:phthalate 4,5-dioxygenase